VKEDPDLVACGRFQCHILIGIHLTFAFKGFVVRSQILNSHLGVIGLHPLHSPPFVKMCFTPKHIFGLMGLCISHLVTNPMLGL